MASSSRNAMTANESTGSNAPSTGFTVPNQMEVDYSGSNEREDIKSPRDITSHSTAFVEQELIPPTSRLSRLPSTVPSLTEPNHSSAPNVAISAFRSNNTNTSSGQDVHFFVNNSASPRSSTATHFGHPSTPLETSVSSFPQPLTQHDLIHPIRRLRTSTVFQSSSDLAAHYGIPQRLPPAPRTTPQQPQLPSPKQTSTIPDSQTLISNYLNMLNNKPTDNSMAASSTSAMTTAITPAEMEAPLVPSSAEQEALHDLAYMLASSPEFRDMDSFDTYMTSPLMPGLDQDYGVSPDETPLHDFLNTPLFEDDALLTSPYMSDLPLFGMPSEYVDNVEDVSAKLQPQFPVDAPYTISPESPALHSFDSFHPSSTVAPRAPSSSTTTGSTRRPSKATGIRKGVTPDSLLDETAPTQPRKYTTPSATSKKEVPATFARKRARSTAFGDEEDQLPEDLPLNPTEKDLIEQKRRQNTVAARRSRKRKLEQFQMMEKSRDEERRMKEMWMERANVLLDVIRGMGMPYPDFPADEPQYADV